MTTMHRLETAEADIAYDVHGPLPTADGRPPLFMIGQPMDASGFSTLASYFPDRTVITYDPRGLGRSTRKDGRVALEGMPVSDDRSAREAFTHVMVTVSRINELSAKARAQAMVGGGAPGDEIAENLREWLDRLVSALPGIVRKLAGATAFSISVGANVGCHGGL